MALTYHAEQRMQQRGIPFLAIELLCHYGQAEYAGDAMIRYFDKRGLKKAKREIQQVLDRMDQLDNMYCVETDEGKVLTTGHRTRHIRREHKCRSK